MKKEREKTLSSCLKHPDTVATGCSRTHTALLPVNNTLNSHISVTYVGAVQFDKTKVDRLNVCVTLLI